MFTAKVYKVMVGSLSGTMEEVFAAKETIRKWNLENAEYAGKLYMLTDWSVKSNKLQNVDVVIGIVGNWVENSDFIEKCIKEGKQIILFFNAFHDPNNTILSEQETVLTFRNKMKDLCFCKIYNNTSELSSILGERLLSID